MEKLKMESVSIAEDSLNKIAELFPNVVTESMGKDGQLHKAIDFDKLKFLLTANQAEMGVVYDDDERYELTWVGKKQAIREVAHPIRKTLRPCPEESRNWEQTQNLYIEGDNLDAMKLLKKSYAGKVDVIYIDPPYNTGKDFIFNDTFALSQEESDEKQGRYNEEGQRLFQNTEANGKFHSDWCSMMYARLMLARTLLNDNGIIFISIDDHELANLIKIGNEVFNASNFIDVFNWAKTETPENLSKKSKQIIEYIVCYQKKKNDMKFQGLKKESVSSNGLLNQPNSVGILTFPANKVVTSIPDGVIKAGMYGTDAYDVELLEDTTVRGGLFTAPVKLKAKFKWSQANLDKEIQKGTTIKIPTLKLSPSYEKLEYDPEVPPNLINHKVGVETNEQAGNHQLQFFDKKVFNFPKPVSLIQYLCEFIDTKNKDCIVMDFFSGSGTTAEAVMRMNMKPRKNKVKYILVQLPEDVTETIKKAKTPSEKEIMQNAIDFLTEKHKALNICELSKERIRRAGDTIEAECNQRKSKDLPDIGFRVFRIADSNMKDVYYSAKEYSQSDLFYFTDNIKEDRTGLDLLYGCLTNLGLSLSLPHDEEDINGYTVYSVDKTELMACFAEQIPEKVFREIAGRQPRRVVFRDASFRDSADRINIDEIFKTLSPGTTIEIL